jgi:thioredoxin-related protein
MKNLTIATAVAAAMLWGGGIAPASAAETALLPEPQVGEDGLHRQPWFFESFLDLREDMQETVRQGKRLVLMWEQRGCPYCKETHQVNLRQPEIVDYIKANFNVIQLNLWGDREVTDLDGETLSEKKFARKMGVQFTPTLQFLPESLETAKGKSLREAEPWRLMGYWKPFHFLNSFVYVKEKGYEKEPNFQRWLQERAEKLRAEGKDVKLW